MYLQTFSVGATKVAEETQFEAGFGSAQSSLAADEAEALQRPPSYKKYVSSHHLRKNDGQITYHVAMTAYSISRYMHFPCSSKLSLFGAQKGVKSKYPGLVT
jgi:hypothetical protein